jgi:hypothetical protein
MEQLLTELCAEYDLVIVDTPPVLAITDALLVGKHTEGVIVVCRMRRTTRSGQRRALEAVDRVHARILGIVINATVEPIDKRYGYANNYISDEREQDESELHPTAASPAPASVPALGGPEVTPPVPEVTPYVPEVTPYVPEVTPYVPPAAEDDSEPEDDVIPFEPDLPSSTASTTPAGYPQQPVPPPDAWQPAPLWPAVQSQGAVWPPGQGPANGPANGQPPAEQPSHGPMGPRRDRRASGSRRRRSRSGKGDT